MSVNIRNYVSDDHIESIGEIAKNQSAIIQALSLENSKLQNQLQQKENIIKEAIEYMKTLSDEYAKDDYDIKYDVFNKLYYEILDKEKEI